MGERKNKEFRIFNHNYFYDILIKILKVEFEKHEFYRV